MGIVLSYLWQLPQNILGLLVILFTKSKFIKEQKCWNTKSAYFGVSLGFYIIFGGSFTEDELKHERGHQKQSLYLGWLYLLVVGLPSIVRNIWDRIVHKKWGFQRRIKWYYGHYPENWADKLGGVDRRD